MKTEDVTVVRVYLSEADHKLNGLLRMLHDEERVRGVTAFRGIAGFGQSGKVHAATLVDLAMDLPLVVEFFDSPERAHRALERLCREVEPGHVLTWQAKINLSE